MNTPGRGDGNDSLDGVAGGENPASEGTDTVVDDANQNDGVADNDENPGQGETGTVVVDANQHDGVADNEKPQDEAATDDVDTKQNDDDNPYENYGLGDEGEIPGLGGAGAFDSEDNQNLGLVNSLTYGNEALEQSGINMSNDNPSSGELSNPSSIPPMAEDQEAVNAATNEVLLEHN